ESTQSPTKKKAEGLELASGLIFATPPIHLLFVCIQDIPSEIPLNRQFTITSPIIYHSVDCSTTGFEIQVFPARFIFQHYHSFYERYLRETPLRGLILLLGLYQCVQPPSILDRQVSG